MFGLWYDRSIRAQLLIVFILIDLLAGLIAGAVIVVNAQRTTRIEIAASLGLAENLVDETIRHMPFTGPVGCPLDTLNVRTKYLRHVRITLEDVHGQPMIGPADQGGNSKVDDRVRAPAWFVALVDVPERRIERSIIVEGRTIGRIVVVGEPTDEIDEVWENISNQAMVSLASNLLIIAAFYVVLGRVLGPVINLDQGLRQVQKSSDKIRFAIPRVKERASIVDHFNALAADLETVRADNGRLNRRLISAQDDERRRMAMELHDEVGPCLFGLSANAGAIATLGDGIKDPKGLLMIARAQDLLAIIARLKMLNRAFLKRLRPMALGHVPLENMLEDLVRDIASHCETVRLILSCQNVARGYGDLIDLTIYRSVQEGLTNAVHHADPTEVGVTLVERPRGWPRESMDNRPCLDLSIRDNGRGMISDGPPGFGLIGMQERIHGLGGTCHFLQPQGGGTDISIVIPLDPPGSEGEKATS